MFNFIKKIFRFLTKQETKINIKQTNTPEIIEAFKRIDEGICDDVMFFINNKIEIKDEIEIPEEPEKNVIIVPKHKPFIKITL